MYRDFELSSLFVFLHGQQRGNELGKDLLRLDRVSLVDTDVRVSWHFFTIKRSSFLFRNNERNGSLSSNYNGYSCSGRSLDSRCRRCTEQTSLQLAAEMGD